MKVIVLKDGEDFAVMVQTREASVFDPAAIYGSVIRMYRVVAAKSSDAVLEVVPMTQPSLVNERDTERVTENGKI